MRIALFGGAFNPVHQGHVEIARAAADRFQLDRVLFVLSGAPPHKSAEEQADYESRYAMLEAVCTVDQRFEPSRLEDPQTLDGRPSYTYDTLLRVRETLAPDDQLYFLLGADAFRDLTIWYRLDDVVALVEFLVVSRPGESIEPLPHPNVQFQLLGGVENPLSSTEIRRRASQGLPLQPDVPAEVERIIRSRGLYAKPLAIRPVEPADQEAIVEMVTAAFEPITFFPEMEKRFGAPNDVDWKSRWRLRIEKALADQLSWVHAPDGSIEAFSSARIDPTTKIALLDLLAVAPVAQGRSLGRRMLRRTLAELKSAGAESCELECLTTNENANRLYESEGFVDLARLIRWYKPL